MKQVRVLKAFNRHSKGAVLTLRSMLADALVRRGFVELVGVEREVAAVGEGETAVVKSGRRKGKRG